jgi:hypothetical protein
MEVNKTLHLLVHPRNCTRCYEYFDHVVDMTRHGAAELLYNVQRDYWNPKLRVQHWDDGYFCAQKEQEQKEERLNDRIDDCESTIKKLNTELKEKDEEIASLKSELAKLAAAPPPTVAPVVPLVSRLSISDKSIASATAAPEGKGKAKQSGPPPDVDPIIVDDDDAMNTGSDVPMELAAAARLRQTIAAAMKADTYAAQAAKTPRPTAGSSRFPTDYAMMAHKQWPQISGPSPMRAGPTGMMMPLGTGGNPCIFSYSPWNKIGAKDNVTPEHPQFKELAFDAYKLPFDQRSLLQRKVIRHALRMNILPPAGCQPETDIEGLVARRNTLPAGIRKNKRSQYLAADLTCWQFLRDGAPASDYRKEFELLAMDMLADGTFFEHADTSATPSYWEPRRYPSQASGFTLSEVATHYYKCGLTVGLAKIIFEPYAKHARSLRKHHIEHYPVEIGSADGPVPTVKTAIKRRAVEHPSAPDTKRVQIDKPPFSGQYNGEDNLSDIDDDDDSAGRGCIPNTVASRAPGGAFHKYYGGIDPPFIPGYTPLPRPASPIEVDKSPRASPRASPIAPEP